jgi:adenylate kinase
MTQLAGPSRSPAREYGGAQQVNDPINIVLIGPPGSGKGTQAARICHRYQVSAISTGEVLRAAVKAGTPLGRQVQQVLASGVLVSDGLIIDLVRTRLAEPDAAGGFVLDGFPRTLAQAQALDCILEDRPLLVLLLVVPEAELERRLGARRICSTCKALYSTGTRYGSEAELCSRCGGMLIRRDDDNLGVIRTRLATYRETAQPIVRHYQSRSSLVAIDGMAGTGRVTRAMMAAIEDARVGSTARSKKSVTR